ncbi:hypothetical protein RRG08_028754 [Elysia crispata]|uniref:Uncharacterized protein n=1 Tax=Elysia crispata TaxID=231223 RepID=A0AAE0ZMZ6_9GAST|nr:hypothetical protein RRG08_028754 [Elysia crispata]
MLTTYLTVPGDVQWSPAMYKRQYRRSQYEYCFLLDRLEEGRVSGLSVPLGLDTDFHVDPYKRRSKPVVLTFY